MYRSLQCSFAILAAVNVMAFSQGVEFLNDGVLTNNDFSQGNSTIQADVELILNMPAKFALTVHDQIGVSNNPIFNGQAVNPSTLEFEYNGISDASNPLVSDQGFTITGLWATNSPLTIFSIIPPAVFTHEDGVLAGSIALGDCNARFGHTNTMQSCAILAQTVNPIDYTNTNGVGDLEINVKLLQASVDTLDRAGKYVSTLSIIGTSL